MAMSYKSEIAAKCPSSAQASRVTAKLRVACTIDWAMRFLYADTDDPLRPPKVVRRRNSCGRFSNTCKQSSIMSI